MIKNKTKKIKKEVFYYPNIADQMWKQEVESLIPYLFGKGVDVAVLLLLIISIYTGIKDIQIVTNLTMIMILYSISLSSIASQFSHHFIQNKKKNVKKV